MTNLLDQTIQEFGPRQEEKPKGSLLDQTIQQYGPRKQEEPVITFDDKGAPVVNATGYSQNDLVEDKYFNEIKGYMKNRFGSQVLEGSREDIVNKFLNNMRGFAAGNSVRAGMEIGYLNSLETDKEKQEVARAYALYEGMEGLFGGDMSGKERLEIVKDYAGTTIFDPINLITLGLGKIASSGGVKLASNAAQKAATKTIAKSLTKNVTNKAAQKSAAKVFSLATQQAGKETLSNIVQREAIKKATEKTFANWARKEGLEIAVTGVAEGAVGVVTDLMYQDAMIRTLVQEDYNNAQTVIAGVTPLLLGGAVSAIGQKFGKGVTSFPEQLRNTAEKINLEDWTKSLEEATKVKKPTKAQVATNKGPAPKDYTFERIELEDLDSEFFIKFLGGDEDMGIKGFGQYLAEQGYGYRPREEGDTITRWIGDIIEEQDPSDFRSVLSAFTDATGIRIKGLEDVDAKQFSKLFKEKISMQGSVLGAVGRFAKIFGLDSSRVTVDDYYEFALTGSFTRRESLQAEPGAIRSKLPSIPEGSIAAAQNRMIRLLVSNLSTTQLNVTGYAAASTMNSVSDIVLGAALSSGKAMRKLATGKGTWKSVRKDLADSLWNTQVKLQNTIDMNTTLDEFKAYGLARPQAVRELQKVIPGGIENIEKISKDFDPSMTMLGIRVDDAIDIVQQLNLVTAQDAYTKSIEFMTQLDRGIRKQYGVSYAKFIELPDYKAKMASKEYALLELKAADETLSAIFSRSFKTPSTPLGELAGFIEDARNIPGLGILVPFGRFFNNTVAFMADNTGVSLTLRASQLMKRQGSMYTDKELLARAAVGWTTILSLVDREMDYIEKGYSWSQEEQIDQSGAVIEEKYEFPYAAFKAAARIIAYRARGEEPPEDMLADMGDTFVGQLTRNLTDAEEGAVTLAMSLVQGDAGDMSMQAADVFSKLFSQGAQMSTRFMAPVNEAVGLARGEDYKNIDVKQGASTVRQATKYINQIIDAVADPGYEERYSPTQGRVQLQATKNISTARESEITDLERVYNMAGIPSYKAGVQTDYAGPKNRYAELYSKLNMAGATALLQDKNFREGTQEYKVLKVKQLMKSNGEAVKQYMASNRSPNDLESKIILDIDSEYTDRATQKALQELEIEGDLDELNYEQLLMVDSYLKFRDSAIIRANEQ